MKGGSRRFRREVTHGRKHYNPEAFRQRGGRVGRGGYVGLRGRDERIWKSLGVPIRLAKSARFFKTLRI